MHAMRLNQTLSRIIVLSALGWLALTVATFTRFIRHARHDGTLDFAA